MALGADWPVARAALIVSVAVAATLSNVTLFAVVVTPLAKVYRHGYEAGQHACQQSTGLRMVVGERAAVVPFRRSVSRSGFDG